MIKLIDRVLENKTRMTIEGHRYRLGNVKHPFMNCIRKKVLTTYTKLWA